MLQRRRLLLPTPRSSLLRALYGYWTLDEASGTRYDSIGGNHLTDNNTVTQNPGKIGGAGQFTFASSEYLSRADNASLSTGNIDFSVGAWASLDSKTAQRIIVAKAHTTPTTSREYALVYDNASDRFQAVIFSSTGTAQTLNATTLGSPSTATWYYVDMWVDVVAVTLNIQVNGGAVDSVAKTITVADTPAIFSIGSYGNGSTYHNGRIDEVGFWKRVLTDTERAALYNNGNGIAYPFVQR